MTTKELIFKLLLVSVTFLIKVSSITVTTVCVENCNITDRIISGGEGENITLKYTIDSAFQSFKLRFHDKIILHASRTAITIANKLSIYPLFDFSNTKLVNDGNKHSFSFKLLSLNRNRIIHNGKKLKSTYDTNGIDEETTDLTINVQYGPEVIEGLLPIYDVKEGGRITLNLTLSGNPEPVVYTAKKRITGLIDGLINPKQLSSDKYFYDVLALGFGRGLEAVHCGEILTFYASGYKSLEVSTKLNVIFVPDVPNQITAIYNLSNCLVVEWNKISSGKCNVSYALKYEYINGTWNDTFIPLPWNVVSDPVRYEKCFSFNTSRNGTISIQATVGDLSSNFSAPVIVIEQEETIIQPSTSTPKPDIPVTETQTGKKDDNFKWYYILIIVIAALILIVIITCIILVATGRLSCSRCCNGKTKPSSQVSGISNPDYQAEFEMHTSVRHLSNAAGLSRTEKEGDYVDVHTMEKQKTQPVNTTTDYAELGPGGRAGEKPKIQPSFYAQVNTDDSYYPPLNPENEAPPIYAVSSKAKTFPNANNQEPIHPVAPVYMQTIRPPSDYEDDDTAITV